MPDILTIKPKTLNINLAGYLSLNSAQQVINPHNSRILWANLLIRRPLVALLAVIWRRISHIHFYRSLNRLFDALVHGPVIGSDMFLLTCVLDVLDNDAPDTSTCTSIL